MSSLINIFHYVNSCMLNKLEMYYLFSTSPMFVQSAAEIK